MKRQPPINKENYILVKDEDVVLALSKLGHYGEFMTQEGIYFKKCEEIERLLEA